jgi:hypothetical protein
VRLPNGDLFLSAARVERWERQIATPYAQLSEAEQDADRRQVDRYWSVIGPALARVDHLGEAVDEVAYEIDRMIRLKEVPQLGQIEWWVNRLREPAATSGEAGCPANGKGPQ